MPARRRDDSRPRSRRRDRDRDRDRGRDRRRGDRERSRSRSRSRRGNKKAKDEKTEDAADPPEITILRSAEDKAEEKAKKRRSGWDEPPPNMVGATDLLGAAAQAASAAIFVDPAVTAAAAKARAAALGTCSDGSNPEQTGAPGLAGGTVPAGIAGPIASGPCGGMPPWLQAANPMGQILANGSFNQMRAAAPQAPAFAGGRPALRPGLASFLNSAGAPVRPGIMPGAACGATFGGAKFGGACGAQNLTPPKMPGILTPGLVVPSAEKSLSVAASKSKATAPPVETPAEAPAKSGPFNLGQIEHMKGVSPAIAEMMQKISSGPST